MTLSQLKTSPLWVYWCFNWRKKGFFRKAKQTKSTIGSSLQLLNPRLSFISGSLKPKFNHKWDKLRSSRGQYNYLWSRSKTSECDQEWEALVQEGFSRLSVHWNGITNGRKAIKTYTKWLYESTGVKEFEKLVTCLSLSRGKVLSDNNPFLKFFS